MVGHSAKKRLDVEASSDSSPFQALSHRLRKILRAHRLLRADRLLLLARPAHIVEMFFSLPAGEAGCQQRSAVTASDETFERSFDATVAADLRTAEFVLVFPSPPQLPRHERLLLAGIDDALMRDVAAIQNVRHQKPECGPAQQLSSVRLPAAARPLLRPPAARSRSFESFSQVGRTGAQRKEIADAFRFRG